MNDNTYLGRPLIENVPTIASRAACERAARLLVAWVKSPGTVPYPSLLRAVNTYFELARCNDRNPETAVSSRRTAVRPLTMRCISHLTHDEQLHVEAVAFGIADGWYRQYIQQHNKDL